MTKTYAKKQRSSILLNLKLIVGLSLTQLLNSRDLRLLGCAAINDCFDMIAEKAPPPSERSGDLACNAEGRGGIFGEEII